jgi:hypothetical protein
MKSTVQVQELKFLALTFGLVLSLGMGAILNFLKLPEQKASEALSRNPASLPSASASEAVAPALTKIESLEWSCGDQEKNIAVSSNRIRVKGRACSKESISIVNETNGLTATVFEGEKGYSSEYMELNLGENQIAINWTDKKGQPQVTRLNVNRAQ